MSQEQKPDLNVLVAKWAPILRMQDWDFNIRYARYHEFAEPVPAGSVTYLLTKRDVTIKILEPGDFPPLGRPEMDIELTVVHEMLHPYIALFFDRDTNNEQLEQFIHSMSSTLVKLDRAGCRCKPVEVCFQLDTVPAPT